MESKKVKKLRKELRRVIIRLSINDTLSRKKQQNYRSLIKKIEKKGGSIFSQKDKEFLSVFLEDIYYYGGKRMAYTWVLYQLVGKKEADELLLKGFKGEKNRDKYGNKIKK